MREFELVLPCYNEGDALESLVQRVVLSALAHGYSWDAFQLVVVDNGSTDSTPAILEKLEHSELRPWFRSMRVSLNRGYGNGMMAGLSSCTAAYVGISHGDGQCDPADAFRALDVLKREEERFPGRRLLIKGERRQRALRDRFVSRVYEGLARCLLGFRAYEANAQPKVFSSSLVSRLQRPPDGFAFDLYLLYEAGRAGFDVQGMPVDFPPRAQGVSKWTGTLLGRWTAILGCIRWMLSVALGPR